MKNNFFFSNRCISIGWRLSITDCLFSSIWIYDRCLRWTDLCHFSRFAWTGKTNKCIWFAVAVPGHCNLHWTTDCWFTLWFNAFVYAWFSLCWHYDCVEWSDSLLYTTITKVLCPTTAETSKWPNRKRDSIIILILNEEKLILSTKTR